MRSETIPAPPLQANQGRSNMTAITVVVPTPLRQYTAGNDIVEVEASTVAEALAALTERYAALTNQH